MIPGKSTAEEVLFEWSHHRIWSTDSKVRTTLHVSIINSGIERVKCCLFVCHQVGLGVDPNDEDKRVPVLVWEACGYTIQSGGT